MDARHVTMLFTDVEGSTRLLSHDPDGFAERLERHQHIIADAVEEAGGELVSTEGDGCFAIIPDRAAAVRAVADAQRLLREIDMPVRMGLHWGAIRRTASGLVGIDIHRAARLADAAHGGQVVLSESTATDSPIPLVDLGWHRLRDIDEPIHVHQIDDGTAHPPLRTLTARLHNVPRPTSKLVGRAHEMGRLDELIRSSRIVTVAGPGGVGKTRLVSAIAAEVARAFRDGVWFVDLTTITHPDDLIRSITTALGVDAGGSQYDALLQACRDRDMLIVLDNMEHVIDAAPDLDRIVRQTDGIVLLVTSREVLRLGAERVLHLEPLGSAAADLFRDRVASFGGDARAASSGAVERICAAVDRLPLAIELAASATRILGIDGVIERLEGGLEPAGRAPRDAPARHRRITDTIGWSYELLEPDEQAVFRRLAVAPAPQAPDAVRDVCAMPGVDVAPTVDALVDKSLVVARSSTAGTPRIAMLDLVRRFAADRLAASGEQREVARRHAVHWADRGDVVEPGLWGPDTDQHMASLRDQIANLETALAWAFREEPVLGARIAGGFLYFLFRASLTRVGERWLERALAVPDVPAVTEARLWAAKGYYTWTTQHRAEHGHAWARALDAAERAGDERLQVLAEMNVAVGAVGDPDRLDEATARAERATERAKALGLPLMAAQGLNIIGELTRNAGKLDRAEQVYTEVLELITPIGDVYRQRIMLWNLSFVAVRRGDARRALELAVRAAGRSRATGTTDTLDLVCLAEPLLLLGRPTAACITYGAGLADADRTGSGWQPGDVAEGERLRRSLIDALGPDRFDSLITTGRGLGRDDAIDFALAEAAELGVTPDGARTADGPS